MPNTLVTIVSVFYNRSAEVEQSVNSLLAQSYTPLEIIIVDDGSTEDTLARLQAISDPRLTVRTQANMGFTRSVDAAVKSAKGEFIAIHGAGDTSLPDRLQRQAAVLAENPDVCVVSCLVDNENGPAKTLSDVAMTGRPLTFSELCAAYPMTHGEAMFRKSAFDAVGGYRSLFTFSQDHDLWLRMNRKGAFWIVPELLYIRRRFMDSVVIDPIKRAFQANYAEFANQCARSWDHATGDILDQHGVASLFLRRRSEKLARRLTNIGLIQLLDGDEAKGRLILASSRTQSSSPRTQASNLLAMISTHWPALWRRLARPLARRILLRRLQSRH